METQWDSFHDWSAAGNKYRLCKVKWRKIWKDTWRRRDWQNWVVFSLGMRRLRRDLTTVLHSRMAEELEPDSCQECPATGWEPASTLCAKGESSWMWEKFFMGRVFVIWGRAQGGGGISILEDFLKLTGQSLEQHDLSLCSALLRAEGWSRDLWRSLPTCLMWFEVLTTSTEMRPVPEHQHLFMTVCVKRL